MRALRTLLDTRYRLTRLRLAIVLYLLVLGLGSIPGARHEIGIFASGFVLHFATYACIAFLVFTGIAVRPVVQPGITCAVIAAMGAFDEYLQSFFAYRTADLQDWYIDMAAAIFVSAILWRFLARWRDALEGGAPK